MDLYFKILDHLSKAGVDVEVEITDLFSDYLLEPKEITDMFFGGERINQIIEFLEKMKIRKHIAYTNKTSDIKNDDNTTKEVLPYYIWVKPIKITASITIEGLDFYFNHILKEATIKSYQNQKWVNRITWFISCVSIGIAVYFGLKSNSLESQVEAIQKRVDTIEKTTSKSMSHTPITPNISTKKN